MIQNQFIESIKSEIKDLKDNGLYKNEYQITGSQSANIEIFHNKLKKRVLNFCANNYLGLTNNSNLIDIAKASLEKYGIGTASVRFICGTMDIHREFENKISHSIRI